MITKERLKTEIDKVQDDYLDLLYRIIKVFEDAPEAEEFGPDVSPESDTYENKIAWLAFVNETYGCLAEDPIERGDQGMYEVREAIE